MKTTLREIKDMSDCSNVVDVTKWHANDLYELIRKEGYFNRVAYSIGVYGLNGLLLQGHETKQLYSVTSRTNAIFILD